MSSESRALGRTCRTMRNASAPMPWVAVSPSPPATAVLPHYMTLSRLDAQCRLVLSVASLCRPTMWPQLGV